MVLDSYINQVRDWKSEGLDWDRISMRLQEQGLSESEADEALQVVKKEIRVKNKNLGMILLGIGSFLCFFSMVYTFFFGHNYFMLYGLTMIGVSIAFAGLVYIMG